MAEIEDVTVSEQSDEEQFPENLADQPPES